LGATLQHYNPLIDQKVADEWQINRDWELLGQLVFGKPVGPIKEKSFLPMENRLIIHDEKQEKSG
jgi:predicted oxidoreductase (fatty acid repression mutant protein)